MNYELISSILIIIVLLFKIGSAPLHNWVPILYSKINYYNLSYLIIIPKLGLTIALIKVMQILEVTNELYIIFAIFSVFSIIIGSIYGIITKSFTKLLAYSSITHIGLILAVIYSSKNSFNTEYYETIYIYLTIYGIMLINIFSIMFIYFKNNLKIKNFLITDFKDFYTFNPYLALALSLCLFSMAGVPPLSGFFIKLKVYNVLFNTGYFNIIIISVIFSIINSYYYLNIIKNSYTSSINKLENINISYIHSIIISLTTNIILYIGFII